MRGIAGFFYRDQRPVDRGVHNQIEQHLGLTAIHEAPGLLMAAAPGRPDVGGISSALAVSSAGNACTWDGRLHNCKALARACGDCGPERPSDAAIALRTYERKGISGLHELIGDWSLAIWDQSQRLLLLATDYAGVRPLYFTEDVACFGWSSSLSLLSRWTGNEELDEEYAALFLTGEGSGDRSPYRGIRVVRPHTATAAGGTRIETVSFWQPADVAEIQDTDSGYAARFRELFEDAVAARMDTGQTVFTELSGGLDSSSIAGMAAQLLHKGTVPADGLVTVTYDDPGSLDQPYVECMEKSLGARGIHLDVDRLPPIAAASAGISEPQWWQSRFEAVRQQMALAGSDVLLTGQLGDLVGGNWIDDAEQIGDWLGRGQVVRAAKETLAWSQCLQSPLGGIAWRGLRSWLNRGVPADGFGLHCPAAGPAAVLTRALQRRKPKQGAYRIATKIGPSRRKHAWLLLSMLDSGFPRTPEPLREIEYSHPFLHRPLVEFMLGIPSHVICRPGQPRRLMRRALRGIIPDMVLERRSKAIYNGAFLRSLQPLATSLLGDVRRMRVVEHGWAEPRLVTPALRGICDGVAAAEHQLRYLLTMEFWLRRREQGNAGFLKPRIRREEEVAFSHV